VKGGQRTSEGKRKKKKRVKTRNSCWIVLMSAVGQCLCQLLDTALVSCWIVLMSSVGQFLCQLLDSAYVSCWILPMSAVGQRSCQLLNSADVSWALDFTFLTLADASKSIELKGKVCNMKFKIRPAIPDLFYILPGGRSPP
jgi:hypothetical protein